MGLFKMRPPWRLMNSSLINNVVAQAEAAAAAGLQSPEAEGELSARPVAVRLRIANRQKKLSL